MGQHTATLKITKTGETTIECEGSSSHLPHKVDVTEGARAMVRLKGSCPPPKTGNIFDIFVFAVIADSWKAKNDGIEKHELRKQFPGLGGDALNDSLNRLLVFKAIALGSCGKCYGLPKDETTAAVSSTTEGAS
jgi:hypothetical protein